MTEARIVKLPIEDATPENFADCGHLLGPLGASVPTAFYGEHVELWPSRSLVMDEDACVSVAHVHPGRERVQWMERHFKHTQVFFPLNATPFVIVVAPPNNSAAPDPERVQALRFDGRSAVALHVGTWHEFPFALQEDVVLAVLLRNETNRDLSARENGEAVGEDLEKRAIASRLGIIYELPTP